MIRTLVKREMRLFFKTPVYIINSALGAVAALLIAVLMALHPEPLQDMVARFTVRFSPGEEKLICAAGLAFIALYNNISAISISLEGRTLWIVKSLPVSTRAILLSKVLTHLALCGIPTVLAGAACCAALDIRNAGHITLMLALPLSALLASSLFGTVINIRYPMLSWQSAVIPIKKSTASMMALFGGIALALVLAIVYISISGATVTLALYQTAVTAAFLAASVGLGLYLFIAGAGKFDGI